MTTDEQKDLILGILVFSFLEDGIEHLGSYAKHVGFDLTALSDPENLLDAWLGHYRIKPGVYDIDRAFNDFVTWPIIANRVAEITAERRRFAN